MHGLDPEARAVLDEIAASGVDESGPPSLEGLRRLEHVETRFSGAPDRVHQVRDVVVEGPGGPLGVRLYVPGPGGPHPAVAFFHGGGWALGGIELSDHLCRALCRASGMLVASAGYRLAPEHPFPAALEDAFAATLWLQESGEQAGARPGALAVCGDSAGGNLAAAVALMARDRGGPRLALQVLLYPALDPSLSEASYERAGAGFGLTREEMEFFWGLYLQAAGDDRNPYAAPALATDLRGLAPALVVTAEYDPLADEGERYARRLRSAGVAVTELRAPGMIHGFMSYLGRIAQARTTVERCAATLRDAMATQLRA
jgi:acetyl esterase